MAASSGRCGGGLGGGGGRGFGGGEGGGGGGGGAGGGFGVGGGGLGGGGAWLHPPMFSQPRWFVQWRSNSSQLQPFISAHVVQGAP
eukprot:scaffold104265_cov29-Tisochrysis_lutea.AAC.3